MFSGQALRRARRVWVFLHRWTGLIMAILFVIISLSGSFLVFYKEIDQQLNPGLVTTRNSGDLAAMQEVLDSVESHLNGRFLHSVFPASSPHDVHHVWLTPSGEDQSRMWQVLVDPYTAEVLGERTAVPTLELTRENITNTVYTLHFQLFAGSFGSDLVGIAGVFLMVSLVSGLVLWWPRSGRWKRGLSIRWPAKSFRLNFDLHKVSGAYGSLFLTVVAFTGVCLTFPGIVRPLFGAFEGPAATEPVGSTLHLAGESLGPAPDADGVLEFSRSKAAGASVTCLWLPGASGPYWRVSLEEAEGVLAAGGRSEVYIDAASGEVEAVERHAVRSSVDQFYAWQLPLHNGSAGGLIGRWLVFLSGFVPLILAITGVTIYLQKRRARKLSISSQ